MQTTPRSSTGVCHPRAMAAARGRSAIVSSIVQAGSRMRLLMLMLTTPLSQKGQDTLLQDARPGVAGQHAASQPGGPVVIEDGSDERGNCIRIAGRVKEMG